MRGESKTQGASPGVLREVNRSLVLEAIKVAGQISRARVADQVGLTKPTVSAIVDALLQEGVIREVGPGATAALGGRRPILLEFDDSSEYVVGVGVGVRRTAIVVANGRGVEVARTSFATPRSSPATALAKVASRVAEVIEQAGVDAALVVGTGVVVPGLVDADQSTCLLAPNLGWRDVPVRELLSRQLGGQIFVHNTSQAAAVAESVEGAAVGVGDVVLLYASHGVGAGILSDRRVFHGFRGLAGEIGHCVVPGASEPCRCGKRGCVETLASGPALARAGARAVEVGLATSIRPGARGKVTSEAVSAAAHAGDAVGLQILADAGRVLGIAASWLVNVVNPAAVVVAGGLAEIGPPLMDPLEASLREHVLPQAASGLLVRRSSLGQDAAVRGAVLLARQNTESYYRVVFRG